MEPIILPSPETKGGMSLEEAIDQRRSVRHFALEPISLSQLSQLLYAASGISRNSARYRTVPSAGATYPLEIYVVCGQHGVESIGGGIYHYDIAQHSLTQHSPGDIASELTKAAQNQKFVQQAAVNIVICAGYERTLKRYGSRGERYVHIEVGHAGQNIYLQATALGLATVAIGAFNDELVRQVLRIPGQYKPLYIMPLGWPA